MKSTVSYQEWLIERLVDPEEAVGYLNAVLEECDECDDADEAQQLLLLALKNVAEAQGGIGKLAKKTGLGRESLYKTLSAKGNPRLSTISTLMHAMGFDLRFTLSSKR